MLDRGRQRILITALVGDAYDGLVRIIGDAQRFGFVLSEISAASEGAVTSISMTILVEGDQDCAHITARLARHPTVRAVDAVELDARRPSRIPLDQSSLALKQGARP